MLVLNVTLISTKKKTLLKVKTRAIVDTGFNGTFFIPKALAKKLKLKLEPAVRAPRTLTNEKIKGSQSRITVRIADLFYKAVNMAQVAWANQADPMRDQQETEVFVPDDDTPGSEVILGLAFLGQIGASLRIGDIEYMIPRSNPEYLDWGSVTYNNTGRWYAK